ncbi:hypothetical protein GCM10023322_76980 [Rugosimonospora acidiphila]|uniref:ABC transporter permease n=1 Tax=Rugosimonospora acidiphila TaxID=556531 RepID=A0ABP9SP44_9ACTN
MNSVLRAMRIELLTWPASLVWCWAILAVSFAVNLALFGIIHNNMTEDPTTGGVASIYLMLSIISSARIAQFFPFTLGLSVTRRAFYAATTLLLLGESLAFGIGLYLLALLERATGGWGMSLHFFQLPFMGWHNAAAQILIYVVPLLVVGAMGTFAAVIFQRWRTNGLFTLMLGTILVLGGVTALVSWRQQWTAIGNWLADQSVVALIAGWPALLAVVLAAGGYLAIRRATA